MRVKDLERKKRECGERGKKEERERERETYEQIQGMSKKKKRLRRIRKMLGALPVGSPNVLPVLRKT
jgi:hypothetical protein